MVLEEELSSDFVVQLLSHVRLLGTPWTAAPQASLSSTISWSLLKLMSIELVMLSNHLILCHPLLLLPLIFPSIRVFSSELALHIRWPKYWTFTISPSNEYSGLMSFRIDQFDLLAVQGILKNFSAPQFKSINSSALSLFYLVILYTVSNISKPCQLEHSKTKLITAFFFLSSDTFQAFPVEPEILMEEDSL